MFDCVIPWSHRLEAAGKPCIGIVRDPCAPRGRLLGAVLRERENEDPVCVTAVRLLLLTACRPGQMRRLRRSEVTPDSLNPFDADTGARHILLG